MLTCPKCYSNNLIRHAFTEAGNQRWSCKSCGHRTVSPLGLDLLDRSIKPEIVKEHLKNVSKSKRWIITSAQNATPAHKGFLTTLRKYAEYNNSELVIIPYRYKNVTSIFTDSDHDWWHEDLVPYLVDRRYELCEGLWLLGDIQVQPTARTPLTGLEGFTGGDSCIVGHPKFEFKTVPTRQGHMAKIMTTTGSVTIKNYTESKAGRQGEHHHSLAATIVEWDGEYFHIRQVTADEDGSFQDLDKLYIPDGVSDGPPVETLTLGDLHQWWVDPSVDSAVFGESGLKQLLKPKRLILHDSIDSYSISHHHRSDPFTQYAKYKNGKNNIFQEIKDFVDYMQPRKGDCDVYIVCSNHDDHITRWIKEEDWKSDPENAAFYLETALHMIRNTKMESWGDSTPRPFDWWISRLDPDLNVLGRDESLEVCGVEHGLHGDVGPNGSRGSLLSLSKIGVKVTVGHGHSPGCRDGCYMVGTSTGKMAYARGPSSWMNTHCVLYSNGKRTLINTIGGRFRG